jgi:hypothetical protein
VCHAFDNRTRLPFRTRGTDDPVAALSEPVELPRSLFYESVEMDPRFSAERLAVIPVKLRFYSLADMEVAVGLQDGLKHHIKAFMDISVTTEEEEVSASGIIVFLSPARPFDRERSQIDFNYRRVLRKGPAGFPIP